MLEFDDRSELGAGAAGTLGGGQAAPAAPPGSAPREPAMACVATAVDRAGFPDVVIGAPSPRTRYDASCPPAALDLACVIRSLLEWGYDRIDLEFMSEGDLRDLHARQAASETGPMPAMTREQVVGLLLEWGYDPLDLEMTPEGELRDLYARLAAGLEEPPCPPSPPWIFDDA